jgi:hypothetical protein
MTLGADVAPPETRSQFLGVWRLCADSGSAGGPLVVSAAASLGSLAAGISVMGAVGIAAAGALLRWVPRYSPFATTGAGRPDTKAAGGRAAGGRAGGGRAGGPAPAGVAATGGSAAPPVDGGTTDNRTADGGTAAGDAALTGAEAPAPCRDGGASRDAPRL